MPILKAILKATVITLVSVGLVAGACGSVRWAGRGGTSARMMASAMMLVLGVGVFGKPPQQTIEEARNNEGRNDAGDPPA